MVSDAPATSPSVDEAIATVRQALRTHHEAYLTALREDGLAPLRDTLEQSRAAHDDVRSEVEALEDPSRRALWAAVRTYRQATLDRVWSPLRDRLDELDLGTLLLDRRTALADACAALSDDVPDTIRRPEPEGLYAPDPTDGWGRWIGKAVVRGQRGLRELVSTPSTPTQHVPMAALVNRELTGAFAAAQADALDAAEQHVVGWPARLERTATAWTHRLLDIERLLDQPSFHDTDETPTLPSLDPTGDPTSGVMAADVAALLGDVREHVHSLDACLADGCDRTLDEVEADLDRVRDAACDRLRASAERADTFMADRRSRSSANRAEASSSDERTQAKAWPDWTDQVVQRLSVLDALAGLRDELTNRHRALVQEGLEAGVAPTRSALADVVPRLQSFRDELDTLLAPPDDGSERDLVQTFDQKVDGGEALIEDTLLTPLRTLTPRRSLRAVLDRHREEVDALIEAQPDEFVVHPLVPPEAETVTPGEPYTLEWTHDCREVLDEVLFDDWNEALTPLGTAVENSAQQAEEARSVVQFNLGAALQELQDLRAARREDRDDGSFLENARELALAGLDRVLGALQEEDATLARVTVEERRHIWRATTDAWTDLHDRFRAAGQARVHVLRLRGQLVRGTHWLLVETGRQLRAATTQVRRTLHRAQRQAQRLVRLGHAAVGTTPVDEAALRETIDALSTVDAVLADLPLVYRRLFSFRPLRGDDLLVARASDRDAIERHVERWRRGLTNAIVLTGPSGSGRTSLLNVLRSTTFRSARRHTIELTERITSEAAFAEQVVQGLNLSLPADAPLTLEAVADHLKQQPVPDRLRVCTIEHLEHVFQRTVGGTALGARILGFLSETDTRVLWIATTTEAAWQLVEASEPEAARLVVRHALDPLDRSELEELILARHRRSGLPLVFDLPDETQSPILARRVRAIDDADRQQTVLRTEFFDRLHEACGQNIILALFYWFRSVAVDDDGRLRVRPLAPISFEGLNAFPLPHAFALKALLEHGTLTVDELAAILSCSRDSSRALLETLGNALIIAPADRVEGPGVFQFASVDRETRYRIRPLLIHPVTRFLRSRNIVH